MIQCPLSKLLNGLFLDFTGRQVQHHRAVLEAVKAHHPNSNNTALCPAYQPPSLHLSLNFSPNPNMES